jgi:hypothetical protein
MKSPAEPAPSRRVKLLRLLLPVASLALVLAVTTWEMGSKRTSPGPLHPAHANAKDTDKGARCEACHESGSGTAPRLCNVCHQPIAVEMQRHTGLHGRMPPALLGNCATCHSDHHGAIAPLIAQHAFAKSGIADPTKYDHSDVLDYALVGAHIGLACNKCHRQCEAVDPPIGGGRYIGLSQSCTPCHEDKHKGAYGGDCQNCHGQLQAFKDAPNFHHDSFALKDAHGNRKCADCHPASGGHSIDALARQVQPTRACAECHENPHTDAAPKAKAKMRIADSGDCAQCHNSVTFKDNQVTAALHARFGFPLRGAHGRSKCADCHGVAGRTPRWHGKSPAVENCRACHESPHQDRLLAKDVANDRNCVECHRDADASFAVATTTAAQHARTGFPLAEPHGKVACEKCHVRSETRFDKRYPGRASKTCAVCHQDVHGGQFGHNKDYAQCTACHAETHFKPCIFDLAAHQRTAFPLQATHQAVTCERCHRQVRDNVRQYAGTPSKCVLCHPDPHDGYFDRAGLPAAVGTRTDCARCHNEQAFADISNDFDHGRWTGWPQTGSHTLLACTRCHARMPKPDRNGSHFGKALGKNCGDCHSDVHQGQFVQAGKVDCARCHDTTRFTEVKFDHQRDSRYPLDETHVVVQCGRCHVAVKTPRGEVVRYKPLGMRCVDCHGDNRVKAKKEKQ